MDYKKVYQQIIFNAQSRGRVEGYKERHHIIPKSLGGTNKKSNLVNLTAREHFIAHMLLAKIYGGNQWAAIVRFKHGNKKSYFNSRLYEIAKKENAIVISNRCKGVPNPKASIKLKGRKNPWVSELMKGNTYGSVLKGEKNYMFGKTGDKHPSYGIKVTSESRILGFKKAGKATCSQKYKCSECDMTTTPGCMGKHQKFSGHVGKIRIL